MTRRLLAGTGWKMNHDVAATEAYAAALRSALARVAHDAIDLFVLPPFTSLHAARAALAGTGVAIGGQNMHEAASGAWTGEISAGMLREAGCRYVALAHSERLAHFGESYEAVGRKMVAARRNGLIPILCVGETADEKARADAVLAWQMRTALAGLAPGEVPHVVIAYEPRWAIGAAAAASPDYVAERHGQLRTLIAAEWGEAAAGAPRIVYGGSGDAVNGPALIALDDVDGLFVGRAAWTGAGFAQMVGIVAEASARRR